MNTQAQVVRNSPLMRDGWKSVFHWGVAGALLAFAGIGMMSIGWFIMPFAVWAFYHASARYRFFPEGISGALLGASAVILFIAFLHRGDVPCPSSGSIIVFHINGRGWKTSEALPSILQQLRERGFRFVQLSELMTPPAP